MHPVCQTRRSNVMGKSLPTTMAVVAIVAAFGAATGPSYADIIVLNQWYTGQFEAAPNTPLFGGPLGPGIPLGVNGPVLPSGFADAIIAPAGNSWTITLTSAGTLTVTDVGIPGDRFQMFDNGIAMLAAPSPFTGPGQNPGQVSPGNGLTSVTCSEPPRGPARAPLAAVPIWAEISMWPSEMPNTVRGHSSSIRV